MNDVTELTTLSAMPMNCEELKWQQDALICLYILLLLYIDELELADNEKLGSFKPAGFLTVSYTISTNYRSINVNTIEHGKMISVVCVMLR